MQLQGGGGSRCGASASDDNAADVRTRPRVSGMIRRTGPRPIGIVFRSHFDCNAYIPDVDLKPCEGDMPGMPVLDRVNH